VQACLAKEPVLAVCLSISHTFTPEGFQTTFSTLYKETVPQRSLGIVDGELNELAMFAALQVACKGDEYPDTVSARVMLHQLHRLLHEKRVVVPWGLDIQLQMARPGFGSLAAADQRMLNPTLDVFYGKLEEGIEEGTKDIEEGTEDTVHEITRALTTTKMPWLVPACKYEDLMSKIREAGAELFAGAKIAGLVPGVRNSAFDAHTYLWCRAMRQEWVFKACSGSDYTLTVACREWEGKCGDGTNSHAMLLGTTGNKESQARIWLEGDKLRIVLLVGSKS
jgi:hypothetical protein